MSIANVAWSNCAFAVDYSVLEEDKQWFRTRIMKKSGTMAETRKVIEDFCQQLEIVKRIKQRKREESNRGVNEIEEEESLSDEPGIENRPSDESNIEGRDADTSTEEGISIEEVQEDVADSGSQMDTDAAKETDNSRTEDSTYSIGYKFEKFFLDNGWFDAEVIGKDGDLMTVIFGGDDTLVGSVSELELDALREQPKFGEVGWRFCRMFRGNQVFSGTVTSITKNELQKKRKQSVKKAAQKKKKN